MRRVAAIGTDILVLLAWAAWFGGLLTLGAVSAPAIFRTARQWPSEPQMIRLRSANGTAAGVRFDQLHHLYVHLSMVQAWLLLGIGVLTTIIAAVRTAAPDLDDDGRLITPEQLAEARAEQARTGGEIGEILVQQGLIMPLQLLQARAHLHGMKPAELERMEIDPEAVALIPAEVARRLTVVPIQLQGDRLVVATANPPGSAAADELREHAGTRIEFLLATREAIETALARHY
jgi:hypothetical protein